MNKNFGFFIWGFLLLLGCSSLSNRKILFEEKPNILFLIADDMGYSDFELNGGKSATPNLNNLAQGGIRFSDFYAAAPNCSPSRTGLMTSRSPARVGMYSYRPPNHPMHLREEEVTIAEVLKEQGYQTAHIGKWHLGCLPQDSALMHPQPHQQGFDYSLGTENNAQPSHLNPVNFVRNGVKLGEQKGYSCQILASEAELWFEKHYDSNAPFFMYVAFHEPHAKVASPPDLVEKYKDYPKKDAEYLANIENLDLAVGRIINLLKDKGLIDNTFILFGSDNGSYRQASNGNLRAKKSYVYDGGIRVPGIIHWTALEKTNVVINEPAGFVDLMPTICDILQIPLPENKVIDGTSILPLLSEKEFKRESPLFWYFYRTYPEIAMRVDNYMILGKDIDSVPRSHQFSAQDMEYIKNMGLVEYELYDLSKDIHQDKNLIEDHPNAEFYKKLVNDKLEEIQAKGYNWEDLPPPNKNRKLKTDWVRY